VVTQVESKRVQGIGDLRAGELRPGDVVEVKSAAEILETLDASGALGGLPFMPEMIEFCGQRFPVSKRVVKTCYYGLGTGMRKFAAEDVVILEGVRCAGDAHDGCQKACTIFWREAWLRRAEGKSSPLPVNAQDKQKLRAHLHTTVDPTTYFCQASEILNSTEPLSRFERFGKCVSEVRAGNCGVLEMIGRISVWLFWRIRRTLFGAYARGNKTNTPEETLNLQRGEQVIVKPVETISETLNETAHNRGLYFTPAMRHLCGEEHRVERRLERIIVDGTGKMRKMKNTVFLEDSFCGCSCVAVGGCPRGEFAYWREIWLRRTNGIRPS
jgi:hypothetical protein